MTVRLGHSPTCARTQAGVPFGDRLAARRWARLLQLSGARAVRLHSIARCDVRTRTVAERLVYGRQCAGAAKQLSAMSAAAIHGPCTVDKAVAISADSWGLSEHTGFAEIVPISKFSDLRLIPARYGDRSTIHSLYDYE